MINFLSDSKYSNLQNNIVKYWLDYIELNISSENTFYFFNSFVDNSPFRFLKDYTFTLIPWKDKSISISYKDIKVASLFENKFNQWKNWLYLTFYWTYFNFDYSDIVKITDLLDIIGFKYNYHSLVPYRFDYCIDIKDIEVDSIFNSLDLQKIKQKNIWSRINTHTWKITWFIINYDDYSVRVYNKKLDIKDKWLDSKSSIYKEYLNYWWYITRIEIVLKRKNIKKYIFKSYNDINLYWQNRLMWFFNKYLYTNFPIFTQNLEDNKIDIEKNIKKEYEFNKNMFLSYYEKLKNSKLWNEFLKKKFILEFNSDNDVFN